MTYVGWLKDLRMLKALGKELSSDSCNTVVIIWGEWRGIYSVWLQKVKYIYPSRLYPDLYPTPQCIQLNDLSHKHTWDHDYINLEQK